MNPDAQRQARTQRQAGFSLLEAVVAIAILGFITMASWFTFEGIVKLKEASDATSDAFASGRIAMARISRELGMVFLTRNPNLDGEPRFQTVFRAVNDEAGDALHFATFSHNRLYRESVEADSTEISYFVDDDDDSPGLKVLLHREAARIDGLPEEGGPVEVLARRVQSFQLRFYDKDKDEWKDEWDSEKAEFMRRIPRAIEVTLVLMDDEGVEHPYSTIVLPPINGVVDWDAR